MNSVARDPTYRRLKERLIASTGLEFYADRDEHLTELIGARLADLGLRNCSRYARLLEDGEKGREEMEVLIAGLTIGETSFFRDEEVFSAIRDVILPSILERKQASRQLRIWSAGCATGAEPYSLAIILMDELGEHTAGWQIAIHATDLNRSYLAQAAKGTFRSRALQAVSEDMKRECFSKEGLGWTIHARYQQWISFHHMNLVDREFTTPWPAGTYFDLILCRNVMIYFAPAVNRRLIGRFHQSLEDEGWLVVGAAEHNLENYQAFRSVDTPGATLYQKMAPPRGIAVAPECPAGSGPDDLIPADLLPADLAPDDMTSLRLLLDRGMWQAAAECGQRLLSQDRLNPQTHFYQALIFENLGIADQAERSLRHAIYLDRNFALAHYHLGLALKRDGHLRASERSFGNVLKVLAATLDEAIVTAGHGVTATGLREARNHASRKPWPSMRAVLETVWRERADRLSRRPVLDGAGQNAVPVIVLGIGKERYGIDLPDVAEVLPPVRVTPVPGAAAVFAGLVNVHGEIRPVIDLRRFLCIDADIETAQNSGLARVILLRKDGLEMGLRIDSVEQIRWIGSGDLQPAGPSPRIKGCTKDRLMLLSTEALFAELQTGVTT